MALVFLPAEVFGSNRIYCYTRAFFARFGRNDGGRNSAACFNSAPASVRSSFLALPSEFLDCHGGGNDLKSGVQRRPARQPC